MSGILRADPAEGDRLLIFSGPNLRLLSFYNTGVVCGGGVFHRPGSFRGMGVRSRGRDESDAALNLTPSQLLNYTPCSICDLPSPPGHPPVLAMHFGAALP